jgi:phage/plasmid-associated DNA primase
MLELKTKKELATEAFKLGQGHQLVRYRSVTYIPADFETRDASVTPDADRTIWLPLTRKQIQRLAADQFNTLFGSDGELSAFDFMVAQTATNIDTDITSLLVRTEQGLMELDDTGTLVPNSGEFRPNTLVPMLNPDPVEKDRVFAVISGWLDSDEEAESLLAHLASALAPGWSAVKYVLLLGEGRNGKSLLLKMLHGVFGAHNVSDVTRQDISEGSAVVTELNGKLLNIVFDGQAVYLKDSGREKSLIAGEPAPIRRLYESTATTVQTNALFIEGLQREPKTSDKSTALQKRLVRFQFPNVYALSHKFEREMLTEASLGAFLSLLVDRYVLEDHVAERLAPTHKAIELQLEQMFVNSMGLQFIKFSEETEPMGVGAYLGKPVGELVKAFQSWRLKEMDMSNWAEPDVLALFGPLINTDRKSERAAGKVRKVRVVTSFKQEATAFIDTLKGDPDDAELLAALVED